MTYGIRRPVAAFTRGLLFMGLTGFFVPFGVIFEVKTSLSALSKNCLGIELDMRNARVCNARWGKVGSSHCYLDRQPLHEIATFDDIFL